MVLHWSQVAFHRLVGVPCVIAVEELQFLGVCRQLQGSGSLWVDVDRRWMVLHGLVHLRAIEIYLSRKKSGKKKPETKEEEGDQQKVSFFLDRNKVRFVSLFFSVGFGLGLSRVRVSDLLLVNREIWHSR